MLLSFESCTPNDLINDDTLVFTKPPRKHTAKSICELKEDIVAYRSSSCVDLSCPNVALIVCVEICSGITGSMIDQVIYHCAQITSVSDLIYSLAYMLIMQIIFCSIIASHTKEDNRK